MDFQEGQAIELITDSRSVASGVTTPTLAGTVGRICKKKGFGVFYCVMLEGIGCRRVKGTRMRATSRPAPVCDPNCSAGDC